MTVVEKISKVILLGSVSIDRIMNFGGHYRDLIQPDKLHVLSLSVLIDSLRHTRGGVAANIAYNLALLGDTSTLLASVGSDGQTYLDDMSKQNIDISHVTVSELPTSTFTVMTDQDDNQVGGFYPGAMSDSDALTISPWLHDDAYFVVSPYDPATMSRLIKESQGSKLKLVYDVGQQVSNVTVDDLKLGVESANLIILNDYELQVLTQRTGTTLDAIASRIPVVVTMGQKGSHIYHQGQTTTILTVPPQSVIDPTGAGDAYRAGMLYGLRRGWDLSKSCRLGSCVASYAIEQVGTQEHVFTFKEVAKRYHNIFKEEL